MPASTQGLSPSFLQAFRAGEESAFDQVFRLYHGPLSYYAYQYVQDEQAAEDIVQDCFLELWERRNKLDSIQSVNSYLYRCVYHHCCKFLRQKKLPAAAAPEPEGTIEQAIIVAETMAHIVQVIDSLPERMRQVLRLHYLQGKSLEEIGQETGIDPETVRSHRYRGLSLLRKIIIPG